MYIEFNVFKYKNICVYLNQQHMKKSLKYKIVNKKGKKKKLLTHMLSKEIPTLSENLSLMIGILE